MAMGVGQNTFAIGSPAFVAGAAIGDAIATGIAQENFMRNCMTIKGWKQVTTTHPSYAAAKQSAEVAAAKAKGQRFPSAPN